MEGLHPSKSQVFWLPKPVLADTLQIELIGKLHEQIPGQSGYYVCVERVEAEGVSSLQPSDFVKFAQPDSVSAGTA